MRRLSSIAIMLVAAFLLLAAVLPAAAGEDRKLKIQVPPAYPELAKAMHLAGTVKLEITISPTGTVTNAKVVGGHPVLADAAVRAVQKWHYDNGPEETRIVSFDFKGN